MLLRILLFDRANVIFADSEVIRPMCFLGIPALISCCFCLWQNLTSEAFEGIL